MTRPEIIELEILFRDKHLVAVNKPAGMLVHRATGETSDNLVLLQQLRDQIGCRIYPVHRLDQPTSGVVLFALSPTSAAAMVDQFTHRLVDKYYQALVRGWMHPEGRIRIPLVSNPEIERLAGPTLNVAYQSAVTDFTSIRWFELEKNLENDGINFLSLVEAQPKTGRWHQIRRHLKHVAHPIIGDYRHGDDRYNRWLHDRFGVNRMLLHACLIEFNHPFSEQKVSIRASRGAEFDRILVELSAYKTSIDITRIPTQPRSQTIDHDEPVYRLFSP